MDTKKKNFAISLLRRSSFRWKPWSTVKKKARVDRGKYLCNVCKKIHRAKDVEVDHILPVVDPVAGWQGFDSYIDRLFCDESGFQIICTECHDKKTAQEHAIRQLSKTEDVITPNLRKKKSSKKIC